VSSVLVQIAKDYNIPFTANAVTSAVIMYKMKYAGIKGIKKLRRHLRKQVHVIGPVAVLNGVA
jgi:hypothetical protein